MRHRWDHDATKNIPACDTPDLNDRTERTCKACNLVKITVHGTDGQFWHRWRKDGREWCGNATPMCTGLPEPRIADETQTAKVISV